MAVSGGGNRESDGFSEINVTPLTDVLLVLLIIFLITGSAITAPAHDITLPEVMTREKAANANIVVDVAQDGTFYVGNVQLAGPKLEPFLADLAKARHTDRVIINADDETPYAAVMTAMDASRQAGLQNIALATSVDKKAEAPTESPTPKVRVK